MRKSEKKFPHKISFLSLFSASSSSLKTELQKFANERARAAVEEDLYHDANSHGTLLSSTTQNKKLNEEMKMNGKMRVNTP